MKKLIICVDCHLERPHIAKQRCRSCYCKFHLQTDIGKAYAKKKEERRGLGKTPEQKAKTAAKVRARKLRLQSEARCIVCGAPGTKNNTRYCEKHRQHEIDKARIKRGKNRAAGLCTSNGCRLPSVAWNFCRKHWFGNMAARNCSGRGNGPALEAMFEAQQGLCAYTGEVLTIGVNTSVDHKLPVTRGGKDLIENLHFVTTTVNLAKRDLTHDEFIALCKLIASRF